MNIKKNGKFNTKFVVTIGIFSGIAFLLQVLGSIMGLKVGGFLEIEFSDVPPLILSLAYGPLAGVFAEFIKNLLHCAMTSTGFVGEFANFVINSVMCLVAGSIYHYKKTFKVALASLFLGTVFLCITGIFVNLYIMLPLYMPNADYSSKLALVMTTILPFNFVKGIVISFITVLIYKKVSRVIK